MLGLARNGKAVRGLRSKLRTDKIRFGWSRRVGDVIETRGTTNLRPLAITPFWTTPLSLSQCSRRSIFQSSRFTIMAPIEPDLYNSNLRPLSIFGGYLILASALTVLISYSVLYKASRALPPSQDTRQRQSNREKHVQFFAILALISLVTTWYHMLQYFGLSYRVWAHEMGEPVPPTLWGENGYIAFGTLRLALGRWLKDTSLFRDAWEIVTERSRRYWWSQQIFLGAAAWSVFVGIEGKSFVRVLELITD
jgi:hypothetical protein